MWKRDRQTDTSSHKHSDSWDYLYWISYKHSVCLSVCLSVLSPSPHTNNPLFASTESKMHCKNARMSDVCVLLSSFLLCGASEPCDSILPGYPSFPFPLSLRQLGRKMGKSLIYTLVEQRDGETSRLDRKIQAVLTSVWTHKLHVFVCQPASLTNPPACLPLWCQSVSYERDVASEKHVTADLGILSSACLCVHPFSVFFWVHFLCVSALCCVCVCVCAWWSARQWVDWPYVCTNELFI